MLNDIYGNIDDWWTTMHTSCRTRPWLPVAAEFDTVLIKRLENSFSLGGSAITWIQSYLADRTQFVHSESAYSLTTKCSCIVAQGSVLGPLLIAFTAPMSSKESDYSVQHHQYADDTQTRAQPLGGPDPQTSRVTRNFWDRLFLGVRFGGSVTRGVGTIIYESLQCTNHHAEPTFQVSSVI